MMTVLDWTPELNVGVGFMDHDHEEAATLINGMAAAAGAERVALLETFLAHCREHFGREEAMMAQTGFFATHCHAGEHERVLAELEGVLGKLRNGDAQDDYFATALPAWLMNHRNTMDYVTADFAQRAGFQG